MKTKLVLIVSALLLSACNEEVNSQSYEFFTDREYRLVRLSAEKETSVSAGFIMIAGFGGGGGSSSTGEWIYYRFMKSDGAIFSEKLPISGSAWVKSSSGGTGRIARPVIFEDATNDVGAVLRIRFCGYIRSSAFDHPRCGPDHNEDGRFEFHVPPGSVTRKMEIP